jgi:hypothetical protein
MTRTLTEVHVQVRQRVHSAMTAAMRADPAALDQGASDLEIDPYSREFVRRSRGLALACGAALSAVLAVHRPGTDAHGQERCRVCGTPYCHTLRSISVVLTAYAIRPAAIDRAEAWRRADAHFRGGPHPLPLAIEEFGEGFVARPAGLDIVLVIDRRSGAVTRWPAMPVPALAEHYGRHRRGRP